MLEAGAARIRDRDPARAAMMLCGAAFAKASQGEVTAAVATAEAAVALAGPLGGSSEAAANSTLGTVLIAAGEGARGYPLLLRHAERGDPSGRAPDGWSGPARLGLFACWMEDYDTARRELERAVALARERGLVSSLPLALSALGELEFRVGNWTSARTHAEEALRLADDADQFLHFGHTVLLRLDAVTGDADGARAYADIVSTIAAHSGSLALELHADAGRGLLELGLDRPEAAIEHLSRTRELARTLRHARAQLRAVDARPDRESDPGRAGARGAQHAGRVRGRGAADRPRLGARRRRALPRSARPAGDRRRGLRRGAPARRGAALAVRARTDRAVLGRAAAT